MCFSRRLIVDWVPLFSMMILFRRVYLQSSKSYIFVCRLITKHLMFLMTKRRQQHRKFVTKGDKYCVLYSVLHAMFSNWPLPRIAFHSKLITKKRPHTARSCSLNASLRSSVSPGLAFVLESLEEPLSFRNVEIRTVLKAFFGCIPILEATAIFVMSLEMHRLVRF